MKYVRADVIFPPEILSVIQGYITDGLVYIPKPKDKHMRWGDLSGEKKRLENRNNEIRDLFKKTQTSLEALATEYSLSVETIKNIVYRK